MYKTIILLPLLYGCETWPLTLSDKRLKMFKNSAEENIWTYIEWKRGGRLTTIVPQPIWYIVHKLVVYYCIQWSTMFYTFISSKYFCRNWLCITLCSFSSVTYLSKNYHWKTAQIYCKISCSFGKYMEEIKCTLITTTRIFLTSK
jgi:hypothetical protein